MNFVRYDLLRREVGFLCETALDVAASLDESADDNPEAPYRAQAVVHLALKVSYLVWRFGRRMTDRYGADEADRLRQLLGVDESSPLSPGQMSPLVELITVDDDTLVASFHAGSLGFDAGGALRPLRPLVAALGQMLTRLRTGTPPDAGTTRGSFHVV